MLPEWQQNIFSNFQVLAKMLPEWQHFDQRLKFWKFLKNKNVAILATFCKVQSLKMLEKFGLGGAPRGCCLGGFFAPNLSLWIVYLFLKILIEVGFHFEECLWSNIWAKHGSEDVQNLESFNCNKWKVAKDAGYHSFVNYENIYQYYSESMFNELEFKSKNNYFFLF